MRIKHLNLLLTFLIVGVLFWFGSATAQNVTTISGRVTNADGSPLEGVKIHVENADLSDVLTKKDGTYKIVVVDLTEARLTFSLKDYEPVTKPVKLTEKQVKLDVRLNSTQVKIEMTAFRSQEYIRGKVTGLDSKQFSNYKIVAYVLTDQWYIHPWAQNAPGKGYATIDPAGNWTLETVWRGYQAYKIAFLLVPKQVYVPPTIRLSSGPPEGALLAAVKCDGYLIIDAPDGI